MEQPKAPEKPKALDDVDFASGFETQYAQEYRPLELVKPQPFDSHLAWYYDMPSILMLVFLGTVFIGGSVLLICKVFTTNMLLVAVILTIYLLVALFLTYMEIQSKHVR